MRILLVEDQDSIRSMIETLVKARGHDVLTASSGAEAIEVATLEPPDLMLLDLMMPGAFDGIDVCRKLRAQAETAKLPIVIVTAVTEDATRKRALAAGATAYYTKPFSPMKLLSVIDELAP
jgi:DNA-binding response OmpR family regulator